MRTLPAYSRSPRRNRLLEVAKVKDFESTDAVVVSVGGRRVGVLRLAGRFYAYLNTCPHEGGPVMEGTVIGNTECEVSKEGTRREFVSTTRMNLACPWHGIEYDARTGICGADPGMRLKPYRVVVEGDAVMVRF